MRRLPVWPIVPAPKLCKTLIVSSLQTRTTNPNCNSHTSSSTSPCHNITPPKKWAKYKRSQNAAVSFSSLPSHPRDTMYTQVRGQIALFNQWYIVKVSVFRFSVFVFWWWPFKPVIESIPMVDVIRRMVSHKLTLFSIINTTITSNRTRRTPMNSTNQKILTIM